MPRPSAIAFLYGHRDREKYRRFVSKPGRCVSQCSTVPFSHRRRDWWLHRVRQHGHASEVQDEQFLDEVVRTLALRGSFCQDARSSHSHQSHRPNHLTIRTMPISHS